MTAPAVSGRHSASLRRGALLVVAALACAAGTAQAAPADADKDKGGKFPDVAQTMVQQMLDGPPLVFTSRRRTDPFRPPNSVNLAIERTLLISELQLSAVVWDKKKSEAVVAFKPVSGSRFAYLLRDGVLLADDNTIMPGVTGRVEDHRIVLTQGTRVVEFYLPGGN